MRRTKNARITAEHSFVLTSRNVELPTLRIDVGFQGRRLHLAAMDRFIFGQLDHSLRSTWNQRIEFLKDVRVWNWPRIQL